MTTTVLRACKIGFAVSIAAFSAAPTVAATDETLVHGWALHSAAKVPAAFAGLAPLDKTRAGTATSETMVPD